MAWYIGVLQYLWELFRLWAHTIFVTPFQNLDMLWLLVPIWLAWFFAEFFQEKVGTSMGNAITNAVVLLWGSIDCTRKTITFISAGTLTDTWNIILRFFLIAVIFAYGVLIVVLGIKGKSLIKRIGRVRGVTYIFVMFAPIFYNAIPFSLKHIVAAVIFFPVFYYIIELIDRIVPNPKAVESDLGESGTKKSEEAAFDDFSTDSRNDSRFDNFK